MALSPGTRLGHYDVTSLIGEGGMGQVWQATDTQLNRQVALKILPDAFAADPDRLARFTREAQILASLNHPNIAAIHGIEEAEPSTTEGTSSGQEVKALVLELVEGPTLADRISKGAIRLDEALPIAKQIAEALEAAHEAGVIHRDLKPANIKVREDGTVKVLDFGLAKALDPNPEGDPSQSPTLTAAATQMGVIMGTAAYMSPEQARGKPVDKRADIWAFGCVLFEMLAGQPTFTGQTVSDTLSAVLRQDVDWAELPSDTPHSVRRLLRRCLERDQKQRLPEIGTARLDIAEAHDEPDASLTSAPASIAEPALWQRPVTIAAMVVGAAAVTALAVWSFTRPQPPLIVKMPIPLGADEAFTNTGRRAVAISPDGSHIAYSAGGIVLRPVGQLQATLLPGTSGGGGRGRGRGAFFSPEGQWIGYWQQGQIRKVAIGGGAPVPLCDAGRFFDASWGEDDTILFGQGPDGIWQVPGTGGTPEQLIAVEDGESAYGPQMLPGGDAVLYTLGLSGPGSPGSWDEAQIVVELVATGERTVLIDGGRDGRFVPTGHLLYVLDNVLFAVPFDPRGRAVTGGPVALVVDIRDGPGTGAAHFSVSHTGSLVYIPGSGEAAEQVDLVWVDRAGDIEPVGIDPGSYGRVRVSPDGTRLAVETRVDSDLWTYDLSRDTLTRLTFDEAYDDAPLWTPDSSRVVFASDRDGGGLFWRAADGTGEAERLLESPDGPEPYTWTADGRLVFDQAPGDIGVLTVDGERTMALLLDTDSTEYNPAISRDGRWLAYQSSEVGNFEVFVRPFPDVEAGQWQVSNAGGVDPAWSQDGQELFFTSSSSFMVARVETDPTFRTSTPERLFGLESFYLGLGRGWDIAPDGERFVFRTPAATTEPVDESGFNGLIFVENWFQELKARVPIN